MICSPSPLAGEGVSEADGRGVTPTSPSGDMETSRRARTLRANQTACERRLWSVLRAKRLEGLKFRRQVPIGPYTVDFLCLRHRLVIEADGPFHVAEQDAKRDAFLRSQGFRVLRFTNSQINAPDQVLGEILEVVEARPVDI
jgi:very-short-patch-repair endonuclease